MPHAPPHFFHPPLPPCVAEDDSPLGKALAAASMGSDVPQLDESFEPWESKRLGILSRYTTNEKLSLATTTGLVGSSIASAKGNTVSEKMRNRLEQLDEEESEQDLLDLSQQEYMNRIELVRAESGWMYSFSSKLSLLN
jgi:hypothetical protein